MDYWADEIEDVFMITRAKGTRDVLDMRLFNFVVQTIREHLLAYNFTEIATPIIEPLVLFSRSLGTQTDVVSKQMFVLQAAGQEQEVLCLRPEATASVVRAYVNEQVKQVPWKVFLCGPMFRHERPQKGRYRQFNQVSLEIIGAHSIIYDVQLLAMLERLFSQVLLSNGYSLQVNYVGCADDRARFVQKLQHFLQTVQSSLCQTCIQRAEKNPLRVFDCKEATCQEIYQKAPVMSDNLCSACAREWAEIQKYLELLSVSYHHNRFLVRGLDYYQKTVFEFISTHLGAQNAFCGGGRYDHLVREIGGQEDQPSLGAAIGIERLMLLLEPIQDQLPLAQLPLLVAVMPLSEQQVGVALLVSEQLIAAGRTVEICSPAESIKGMMRRANSLGARYAVIIGSEEMEQKTVMLKDMITGKQEVVAQVNLLAKIG